MTILSKPSDVLVTICCWCPGWDRNDPRNATASHGICPACLAREFAEPVPTKDAA